MEKEQFYKFPKTPHVTGSSVVDEDQVISLNDIKILLGGLAKDGKPIKLLLQEKVDGANVSVHFEREWEPIMQKRSGIIGSSEKPQYDVFRNWCYERMETLWEVLKDQYVLFGEWLWCKHAIYYDKLPDFFVAFDIYDKKAKKFLSNEKLRALLKDKFTIVPSLLELGSNQVQDLEHTLEGLVKQSHFGKEIAEGIYLRFENKDFVLERCKFRRATFVSGRESFHSHVENNTLANDSPT